MANPTIAYLDAEGATQFTTDYNFLEDKPSTSQWTTGTYVVGADYNGDGVINAADAEVEGKQTEFVLGDMVTISGDITLIIADGFSLSVSATDAPSGTGNCAIVRSADTDTLTITAQSTGDNAGKLTVTGGKGAKGTSASASEAVGKDGGIAILVSTMTVNAGNITVTGGQGGNGGIYDNESYGGNGGNGEKALTVSNLTVNNGTLIANGGKGGKGGKGDESTGADGTTGQAIDCSDTKITGGSLIMNGGTDAAGAYSGGEITNGTNPVKMYDLAGNELSFSSGTYKYGETPATQLASAQALDLVSVSSLGEQGGVTFTVDGTETAKAWAGTTVTVAGVAVEGYYIAGFTSDQVTISTDNTFVMPETAVTVTATYAAYDNRITVDTTTYPEGCTLESGKTYKAVPYEGNGGMVKVTAGGTLNTNGAGFSGNSVTRSQDDGGAIHNQGTVNVSDGSFTGNSARHDGGAIYNKGGTTNITGTDFTSNYTKVLGGAITTSGGVLNITSATFANNVAGSNGGAIFNSSGCAATLTDVAFYGNAANGIYSHEGGGAIENTRGGIMTLSNVTFDGNTAQFGGAIYNYTLGTINLTGSVDLQTDTDTWVNEGYYNSYYETEEGSVVNWDLTGVTDPAQSTVTINGFQRYSNKKTDVNGEEKLLVNQTITVNAEGAQAAGEYVLATGDFDLATLQTNLSTDFTVTDGTNNVNITVNGDTGSIGDQGYKIALVESEEAGADQLVLSVINYTAERIVVNTTTYPEGCTLETGKTYTAKPHKGQGGAFKMDDNATLTGKDVTFADNTVTGNSGFGGAIFGGGTLTLDGATFTGNSAEMYGGAIVCHGVLSIDGASFSGNSAGRLGGAVIVIDDYKDVTIANTSFSENVSNKDGGAIEIGTNAALTLSGESSGTVFTGNKATGNGGAIYFEGGDGAVTIDDTVTFTGNTAGANGGAIYTVGTVNLNGETTFTGNTAGANGGAIYNQGTITINGATTFSGNTVTGGASKGGAIFNAVNSTLNMANTVTLATETDTVYNGGTLNWDLTGETTGKLEGYQYLDNDGGTLQITVKDSDKDGDKYVIATGNMSSLTGKATFTLTGVDGQTDITLTVNDNGGIATYNGQGYKLTTSGSGDDGELVLSVVHNYTLVLKDGVAYKSTDGGTTLGDTVTLEGLSFADGIWTMDNFTFETCAATAVSVQGDSAVTITVTGDNVITGGDSATTDTIGLNVTPDLTLKGSGSLTVTAGDVASECSYGLLASQKLDVSGITLNVSSEASSSGNANAIVSGTSFTVTDAFVTANAGATDMTPSILYLGTLSVKGYGKITATLAKGNSAMAVSASSEPDAGAQWDGTVLVWDSVYLTYMNGSDFAANAILTKTYDERINNMSGSQSIGEEGSRTVFTTQPSSAAGSAVRNTQTFTATNVTFANNVITGTGAGGTVSNRGSFTFNGTTEFTGNNGGSDGGGVFNFGNTATITFEGTANFDNNTASFGGGAVSNDSGTAAFKDTATFTGNTATGNGGAILNQNAATVTFEKNATFNGNTAGKDGGAIYNSCSTISFAGTMDLQTETDTWVNLGSYREQTQTRTYATVNWDLTGGTEQYGSIKNFQYYSNEATNTGTTQEPVYEYLATQTITVNEKQTKGEYVLATGDMTGYDTDETGKYAFNLTGIAGAADVAITIGDTELEYGKNYYSLAIDDNGTAEDPTDDKLVLTVKSQLGAQVDDDMEGKWFKAGETITITGTYDGEDITSFTFGGNAITDYSDGTWSYTFTSHEDTKGTDYDIVISTADESETTTYTLKVDTVAPSVENTAFAGDTKYVDTETGKTWFKKDDTTAVLNSVITDETSGLDEVTYNDIAYDETESRFVLSTASEVDVDAQNIQAADAAGNENNTVSVGAYGVDGTAPDVASIYTSDFKAASVYVDPDYNVWVKQGDTLSVDVTITDDKSGLKNAVAVAEDGTEIEYKDKAFSNLDTSTEVAWGTRYNITATDNVGNENTSATLKYGVDGTGPEITLKNAVTATVCNELTPAGAPDSANVTKTTDTVDAGTDMSGTYTSSWFSAVDTPYTITIEDQILKKVTVNDVEQTLSGTSFDYTFSNLVQGENVYTIVATDGVGNETTSTITLKYDSESPVFAANSITVEGVEYAGQDFATAIDNPVIVTDVDSFTVTLNATDTSSLTNWYSFSVDGTSWTEWETADAAITTGEGYYRFATVDAAGNSTIADKYFYIGRQIEYTLSDAVDVTYDGEEHGITVTITDPEDGVGASVYWSIDGGENWTLTEDSTYMITDATVEGPVSVCFKLTAEHYCDTYTESTTINIDPKWLTVSGTTVDDKVYDGTTGAVAHAGTLSGIVEGDEVTLKAEGGFNSADAGKRTVAVMYTLEGEDADNYTVIVSESISATIEKRSVTLESASDTKVFDGTPLTNDTVTVSGEGWAEGEGASYAVTGSQTEVGSSANTFTYTLNEGTKAGNYKVSEIEGELTVTAAPVNNYNQTAKSDMIQFVNGKVYVTYDTEYGYMQTPAIADITGWNVMETRRDLTGDGLADVQITADAGDMTCVATLRNDYLENDAITLSYQFIGTYDNKVWTYMGSADVNGDGKAEVLMMQTYASAAEFDGHRNVAAWVTDENGEWAGNEWVGALTSDEWGVAGTADVDGDGTDNVILRRFDGMIGYWDEAGTNNIVEIRNAGDSVMLNTADFSGDGADDFLFTNADRDLILWSDVGEELSCVKLGNLDEVEGWNLAGAGDYNGDGKEELLWCNGTSSAYSEATQENYKNLIVIA